MESTLRSRPSSPQRPPPKLLHFRFFAGFTSSLAFRYSVTFMIRLRILTTTPPVLGMSFFLYCSFRGFGCGKATSFGDLFRRYRPNKTLQRNYSHKSGTTIGGIKFQ